MPLSEVGLTERITVRFSTVTWSIQFVVPEPEGLLDAPITIPSIVALLITRRVAPVKAFRLALTPPQLGVAVP